MIGRIVDIQKEDIPSFIIHTGVKGPEQYKYDQNRQMIGGRGTYLQPTETLHFINVKTVVYTGHGNKTVTTDCREQILQDNQDWIRISSARMNKLIDKLKGKKIIFDYEPDNDTITFPRGTFTV